MRIVGRDGVPELVGPTPEDTVRRVREFLGRPGPRLAVVTGAQAEALGDAVLVLHRDDAFQRKKRSVALVAPKAPEPAR
jgi:hypothetical protein